MATLSTTDVTSVTGTQSDSQFASQVIGKEIPIFVGGHAVMGCRIIEGPFIYTDSGAGYCDMIVSCAVAATPTASRSILSLNLNGTQSWTLSGGFIGSAFSGMSINFLYGTETQTPLASSVARYGSRAVPYRSHIGVELKRIPLAAFANQIPFVSIHVYEQDFLIRNDALYKLAAFARFDTSECDFAVSGQDPFWIVIQQSTFMGYLQDLQKTIGRKWNIVPGQTLRVFENKKTDTPITITRSDVVMDSIEYREADPLSIPAIRTLNYIDTGKDNDFNAVKARRARFPIALTASENSESYDIPIGMTALNAQIAVNESLLIDDIARETVSFKALPHMRGLSAGDVIFPDFDEDIDFAKARIISVARNAADFTADIVAERVEVARLSGPSVGSPLGLLLILTKA